MFKLLLLTALAAGIGYLAYRFYVYARSGIFERDKRIDELGEIDHALSKDVEINKTEGDLIKKKKKLDSKSDLETSILEEI